MRQKQDKKVQPYQGPDTMVEIRSDVADAFNRWMSDYIRNPKQFEKNANIIQEFLKAKLGKRKPSYGEECLAVLEHYIGVVKKYESTPF